MYLTYYSKAKQDLTKQYTEKHWQKILEKNNDIRVTVNLPAQKINNKLVQKAIRLDYKLKNYAITLQDIETDYKTFKIPKASGGYREISAPNEDLKKLQQHVLKDINALNIMPHNATHGFTRHRNCKTALLIHQANKSRWFLKLDIHNFFPSITTDYAEELLSDIYPFAYCDTTALRTIISSCTINDKLIQGSPLSPFIANMVMLETDITITNYCKEHKLIYTRYADDILISSKQKFNADEITQAIKELLPQCFSLSDNKTRFGSFAGRNWNLGLMYNENYAITIGHKNRHIAKCRIHNFIIKPLDMNEYYALIGLIGYYNYIEDGRWTEELKVIQNKLTETEAV